MSFNGWQALKELKDAESGSRKWAYDDPVRVAVEALRTLKKRREGDIKLARIRETPSRITYRWNETTNEYLTVIVTRPYWLSTYAKNGKVPWVVTNIKSPSSCE